MRRPGPRSKQLADAPRVVHAAWVVSIVSVAWTALASSLAIAFGLAEHSTVLLAFGAIGYVDASGSVALAHHFWHGHRHSDLSERREQLAHRIVVLGLVGVGVGVALVSAYRLASGRGGAASPAGVALAGASLVALGVLSARKRAISTLVSSPALRSDGHLSAIGAIQAAVALGGTAATAWLEWGWADASAALAVGLVAVVLGARTWVVEARERR